MFTQTITTLATAALVAFSPAVNAFNTSCVYEEYRCGYSMISDYGYNVTELGTAANMTGTIPPLDDAQLLKVLYRCDDVSGGIVGNSYCIAGCITIGSGLENDMCAM